MKDQQEFLKGLGLNPDAPNLVPEAPAKVKKKAKGVKVAPEGIDPHSMPVDEIEFDPALLDEFDDLAFNKEGNVASRKIFDMYKSHGRDPHRNGALQRKITSFITLTRRNRATGGMVKETIKATAEQRDMAAVLASEGVTMDELVALLRKKEK